MNSDKELAQVDEVRPAGLEIAAVAEEGGCEPSLLRRLNSVEGYLPFFRNSFCLLPGGSSMTIFLPFLAWLRITCFLLQEGTHLGATVEFFYF